MIEIAQFNDKSVTFARDIRVVIVATHNFMFN